MAVKQVLSLKSLDLGDKPGNHWTTLNIHIFLNIEDTLMLKTSKM